MPWQIVLGMAVCAVVVALCVWAAYELGCEDGSRRGTKEGASGLSRVGRASARELDTLPSSREALREEQLSAASGVSEAEGAASGGRPRIAPFA
jgi:hypothetical protein